MAGNKFLVVDDMSTMRKIICKTINEIGNCETVSAQDGIEAWEKLTKEVPSVTMIVSDWNMPKCSGIELLRKVRSTEKFKDLPFVLLTAEAEAHQVGEAVKLGVTSYIVKPFTPESLKEKLTAILTKVKAA